MSQEIKVAQLLESAEALRFITGINKAEVSRFAFKAKAKQLLSKRLRTVTEMLDEVEKDRQEMLKKHGITQETDKDGKPKDSKESIDKFNKEWTQEYTQQTVIVECGKIQADLLDLDKNDIPTSHLAALDWLFEFSEETETPKAAAAAPAAAAAGA